MVDLKREGFVLLMKLGRAILKDKESAEVIERKESTVTEVEPMTPWTEKDSLDRIPDVTETPTRHTRYQFENLRILDVPAVLNNLIDVPETPKIGAGVSSSGRDAGVVAGIVVAVISGVIILAALIAVVMYRHYVHRNVTSMNFDNPVYRKTTEDQFALEKNGYAPGSKLYPSTVGEEAQEPLNTPGTNDFV